MEPKKKLAANKETVRGRSLKARKELEINPWFIKDEDAPEL